MSSVHSPEELLSAALQAAALAAPEILSVYQGAFSVQRKSDRSPITEADRRSNAIIQRALSAATDLPILSEEGRSIPFEQRRGWARFWLVDPLDGTKEFVKRNGEFTINIALIEHSLPVLGVVYAPVLDLLYFACPGSGSFRLEGFAEQFGRIGRAGRLQAGKLIGELFGQAVRLERRAPLDLNPSHRRLVITVVGSRSHPSPQFDAYVAELGSCCAERVELLAIGSALKPCLVAEGKADIYPRFGPTMEWDTAAAHAVVREVGKSMVAYESRKELVYNKEQLVNPSFLVY